MTEFSAPFDGSQIATELQWSRMARRWGLDGVHADSPSSTDLKVTGNGTGNVSLAPGSAYVNGFFYRNDAAMNIPVTANAGGSARVDLVVLRADPSANAVNAVYKTGGAVAPTLTQDEAGTWEIPLAQCTVAAGSSVVTATNVLDQRWFTGKAIVPSIASQRRPPTAGLFALEGSEVLVADGSNWNLLGTIQSREPSTYTPVWTAGTAASSTVINWGNGSQNSGRYRLLGGKLCWVSIQLTPTGNPAAYDDPIAVTLPLPSTVAYRQIFTWNFTSSNGEGSAVGVGMTFPTESATKIARLRFPLADGISASSTPNSLNMLTNDPFNIRTGDVLTITGTYEIA
ncbi:hypothetical protein [Streptomyces sp. NPDC059649]|uniref:hypothetical protein n=1 Tax=Streptomyces sp. NPDC059649 TaxID=3346895 RepID=UPI003691210B